MRQDNATRTTERETMSDRVTKLAIDQIDQLAELRDLIPDDDSPRYPFGWVWTDGPAGWTIAETSVE